MVDPTQFPSAHSPRPHLCTLQCPRTQPLHGWSSSSTPTAVLISSNPVALSTPTYVLPVPTSIPPILSPLLSPHGSFNISTVVSTRPFKLNLSEAEFLVFLPRPAPPRLPRLRNGSSTLPGAQGPNAVFVPDSSLSLLPHVLSMKGRGCLPGTRSSGSGLWRNRRGSLCDGHGRQECSGPLQPGSHLPASCTCCLPSSGLKETTTLVTPCAVFLKQRQEQAGEEGEMGVRQYSAGEGVSSGATASRGCGGVGKVRGEDAER